MARKAQTTISKVEENNVEQPAAEQPTAEQHTGEQTAMDTEQPEVVTEQPEAMPTVESLLVAVEVQTNRTKVETDIKAKYTQLETLAQQIGMSDEQRDKFAATLGISGKLDDDLASLKLDLVTETVLTELADNSASVWTEVLNEMQAAQALLDNVNRLRTALGHAPFWIAQTGTTTKRGTTRGDNGSKSQTNSNAKFVRPGVMHLEYKGVPITWASSVGEHTLTGGGHSVTHKQGSIGVASAIKSFIQDTLGYTGNLSTPAYLARHGYSKDDVYMLTAPDKDTPEIKQPVKDATK